MKSLFSILLITLFSLNLFSQSCPDTTVAAADTIIVAIDMDSITFWEVRQTDTSRETEADETLISAAFGTVKQDALDFMTKLETNAQTRLDEVEILIQSKLSEVEDLDTQIGVLAIEREKLRKKITRIAAKAATF
jgi:peptidoglycan hydrolase CwlO-like protein